MDCDCPIWAAGRTATAVLRHVFFLHAAACPPRDDDSSRVHPCNFRSAYEGFEIMMAFCRSAATGGRVALPLSEAVDELELLRRSLPERKVLLSTPGNAKEYGQ